jgi:hypothetical protein
MSLLQLKDNAARGDDASAKGEDYAKGSSYILWTALAAFLVLSAGITLFLMSTRKPPVAAGEVTQVWIHPVHTINRPTDAAGVQQSARVFDQVLVFAHLRVRNQSDQPIVIKDLMTNATMDGAIHSSYAASPVDFDRIFIAYPDLKALHTTTLSKDTIIQPNQVLDGLIVSAFHVSQEAWDSHQDMNFNVDFKYHPGLVLTPTPEQIKVQ